MAQPTSPVAGSEPIVVTGTLECLGDAPSTTESTSTEAETGGDGVVHLHRWVASDPRLEGEVSYTGRWQLYGEPAEDSGVPDDPDDALYAIVNEGGSLALRGHRGARSAAVHRPTGTRSSSTATASTKA